MMVYPVVKNRTSKLWSVGILPDGQTDLLYSVAQIDRVVIV